MAITNNNYGRPQLPPDPDTTIIDTSATDQNQNEIATAPLSTISITDGAGDVIGEAPHATRPEWLPDTGAGQSTVGPLNWSISLENLVKFLHACTDTDTWRALVTAKGEKKICMHDLNTHFIKPWTHGTGCSLAGLMDQNQGSVELMISHSWTGSVTETLSILESLPALYFLPKETRVFFCTMCLYQPEDHHQAGLTIEQQIELQPFSKVIEKNPKHGMYVFHTTVTEVYERLWCVLEINECVDAKVSVLGAFDLSSWDNKKLRGIIKKTNTCEAECGNDRDKKMLTDIIMRKPGGFKILDKKIKEVRQRSIADLVSAHTFQWLFGVEITTIDRTDTIGEDTTIKRVEEEEV